MLRKLCLIALFCILAASGCSNSPTTPSRDLQAFQSGEFTFQLALFLVNPDLGNPTIVPTDVPIRELLPEEQHAVFASYALCAFDVYYEPADWDDWLTTERVNMNYEPDDWDDWLVGEIAPKPRLREVQKDKNPDLVAVGEEIDPLNIYEPDDWDDWLVSGGYEPDDWDDWLINSTIAEVAELK